MTNRRQQLYADQQAAYDALASVPDYTTVRLPHRGTTRTGVISRGSLTDLDGHTRRIIRIRWRNISRNQYRTLMPRDLAHLEIKRGHRYEPWSPR